jgi:hypothetical protein
MRVVQKSQTRQTNWGDLMLERLLRICCMYVILDFKKVSNATSQKTFDVENSTPFYSPFHILQ